MKNSSYLIICVVQHSVFVSGTFDIPALELLQKVIAAPRPPLPGTQDPGKPLPPQPLPSQKAINQKGAFSYS